MTDLGALTHRCDALLKPENFPDAALNGLQVACRQPISRIATGVTASAALIEKARDQGAQLVLTHHGLFWEGQSPALRGGLLQRVRTLIENDMALVAYHLPLDAHPELGNNGVLAQKLALEDSKPWGNYKGAVIGMSGRLPKTPVATLTEKIETIVQRPPLCFAGGPREVKRVAIVSGGAASMATDAARDGFDVFLTGEPSESCMHVAAEEQIHIIAAGHHATETFGVQALADRLAGEFPVEVVHLDIPNPV